MTVAELRESLGRLILQGHGDAQVAADGKPVNGFEVIDGYVPAFLDGPNKGVNLVTEVHF